MDVAQAWRPQESEPTQRHITHTMKWFGFSTARNISICHPLSPAVHTLLGRGVGFPQPLYLRVGEPAECSVQLTAHRLMELCSKCVLRQQGGFQSILC